MPGLSLSAMRALNPAASSTVPAALEYSPLSAGQKKEKPRPGGPGLQFPRGCMARGAGGWPPPSSALILIQRKLSHAVSRGLRNFFAVSRQRILRARVSIILLLPLQQLRQLGDAGCDLSRFILRHEICCCTSTRLRLEIDVSHGKVVGVADDIGDAPILLDGPGRWRQDSVTPRSAPVCNHSPIMRARRSRSAGQVLRKDVIDGYVIRSRCRARLE